MATSNLNEFLTLQLGEKFSIDMFVDMFYQLPDILYRLYIYFFIFIFVNAYTMGWYYGEIVGTPSENILGEMVGGLKPVSAHDTGKAYASTNSSNLLKVGQLFEYEADSGSYKWNLKFNFWERTVRVIS